MHLEKYKKTIVSFFILLFIIFFILAYFYIKSINTIVNIVIISFILAYTLGPIRDVFQLRLKASKKIASILVISLIIGIAAACLIVIVPALFDEMTNVSSIIQNVNVFFQNAALKYKLNNILGINIIYNELLEKGNSIWINFSESAIDNLIKFSGNIISFAIIPIMIYYFLCDGNKIFNKILLLLPTDKRGITKNFLKDIDMVLTRYIASQLLLSAVIGMLTFVLLFILKVKFLLWISILNAILNIIPYFGPIFGSVPAIAVALLDSPIKAFWVMVGMFVIQQLEGDILAPKMTGDSTDMHPFVIILLLIAGDNFGGFIGMVLAVPIAVIIKVIYDDINYYLF